MYDGAPLHPDGLYPHPLYNHRKSDFTGRTRHYTRTQVPIKYHWIDFGISNQYDPSSTATPVEDRIWGGDRTVPEYFDYKGPCNPFHTDVYYVGNLIKTNFIDVSEKSQRPLNLLPFSRKTMGFPFMVPLISDMIDVDPTKRPTTDQVVTCFDEISRSLSQWKLRSRVVSKEDSILTGLYRAAIHAIHTTYYLLTRKPAVPVP